MQAETRLARAMLGRERASALMTDAYKLSMAQAGFPLRRETFYLSFRRHGPWYVPFDLAEVVRALRPTPPSEGELGFLKAAGYAPTAAMLRALEGELDIQAAPAGSWVFGREPMLTVTGPSFLVSWLEPLLVALHYPVQVATEALDDCWEFVATCESEAEIIRLAAAAVGTTAHVEVRPDAYVRRVTAAARRLLAAVDGDAHRLFEVGLRAATCMAQHLLALHGCAAAGLTKTSNLHGARALGLEPVGTAGHEHQQRWGEDGRAFRALRDMRCGAPSYLLDTNDVFALGLPCAAEVMREDPSRACSVRFDSGDQEAQLRRAVELFGEELRPTFIFEDGYDARRTQEMEVLGAHLAVGPARRLYGFGSELVARTAFTELTRDRASAVYKLSRTASRDAMKFSASGKQSVPGRPTAFRRVDDVAGPLSLIGQLDESPPPGYARLHELKPGRLPPLGKHDVGLSPATRRLVEHLMAQRDRRIAAARADGPCTEITAA